MLENQKYELLRSELKKARLNKELLQINLANKLRKPQSYISKVESGERRLDVIEFCQYCHGIGIDPSLLLKKMLEKY